MNENKDSDEQIYLEGLSYIFEIYLVYPGTGQYMFIALMLLGIVVLIRKDDLDGY